VPAAPSNAQTTAVMSSQVTLTWNDNSTNETGFTVYRQSGTGRQKRDQHDECRSQPMTADRLFGVDAGTFSRPGRPRHRA